MNSAFQLIQQHFRRVIELMLPAQCLLCQLPSNDKLICVHCQKVLNQERTCCLHCGLSLDISLEFCGDCLQQKFLFTKLHALASYQAPYPKLIKQLKYEKKLIAAELLGKQLATSMTSNLSARAINCFDYIIAVPLHNKKLRQRGFNQAQLIAQVVSKQINVPLLTGYVERNKETVPQEGLSIAKRKRNLQGAFTVNKKIKWQGKHIAVIDDVVTTGATINSLCQCLIDQDIASITVLCICRTDPFQRNKI